MTVTNHSEMGAKRGGGGGGREEGGEGGAEGDGEDEVKVYDRRKEVLGEKIFSCMKINLGMMEWRWSWWPRLR